MTQRFGIWIQWAANLPSDTRNAHEAYLKIPFGQPNLEGLGCPCRQEDYQPVAKLCMIWYVFIFLSLIFILESKFSCIESNGGRRVLQSMCISILFTISVSTYGRWNGYIDLLPLRLIGVHECRSFFIVNIPITSCRQNMTPGGIININD